MNVLIAEDEQDTRELLCSYFESQGHQVNCVNNGKAAIEAVNRKPPDFMLLDIRMPQLDGWEVMKKIRQTHQFPVLILSALAQAHDAVRGLSLGADDYLRKPFDLSELDARIRAILRRSEHSRKPTANLEFAGLRLNHSNKQVFYNDQELHLTPKEFALLQLLASEPEHTFSIDRIVNAVWGKSSVATGSDVKQYILMLRKKLDTFCGSHISIKNRKGFGYHLSAEA